MYFDAITKIVTMFVVAFVILQLYKEIDASNPCSAFSNREEMCTMGELHGEN